MINVVTNGQKSGTHIGTKLRPKEIVHTLGFPPRIMSVPLPAILVEMVIANFLPACATISASLAAY